MRTLTLYNSSVSWGGLEMNMVRIAGWLSERGWETLIVAQQDSPISIHAQAVNLRVIHCRKPWRYGDLPKANAVVSLMQAHSSRDLILFQNYDLSLAANTKFLSQSRIRTVYLQQMRIGVNKRDPVHTWRYRQLDAWISPLESLAEEVVQRTLYPKERIHVVPLCVDLRTFHFEYTKKSARSLLDLDNDILLLGIIGRLDPQKGQEFLIRSLKGLRERGVDAHLLIVGGQTRNYRGDYQGYLQRVVKECGLAEQVHFRPFSDDVSVFFRAVDIFTLASESEPYGMVTLEALIHGLPVIATNSGGTPELLRHGQLGILYEPRDTEDFINRSVQGIGNLEQSRRMMVPIAESIRREYSHEVQCEGIEQVLATLAG